MSYLGVLESVKARLSGASPQFVPDLKMYDQKKPLSSDINSAIAQVTGLLTTPSTSDVAGLEVPVYFFGIEGALDEKVYPSFTYEIISCTPRFDEFSYSNVNYGGNVYIREVPGTEEDITVNGEIVKKAPRMVTKRALEQPVDILFEIRAYSNDPFMSALMVQKIYELFPPRHFLRVPQKDGSYRSWDMFYETFQDTDKRQAVLEGLPGTVREYAKIWTYRVEGYLDNTDTAILVNLCRQKIIKSSVLGGF